MSLFHPVWQLTASHIPHTSYTARTGLQSRAHLDTPIHKPSIIPC